MCVELTVLGATELDRVIACVTKYVEILRHTGVQKWAIDEQQSNAYREFRFQEKQVSSQLFHALKT